MWPRFYDFLCRALCKTNLWNSTRRVNSAHAAHGYPGGRAKNQSFWPLVHNSWNATSNQEDTLTFYAKTDETVWV